MRFANVTATTRAALGCLGVGALVAVACADGRALPTSPSAQVSSSVASTMSTTGGQTVDASVSASSERSGNLAVTKECSQFGEGFCTITSSNVKAIEIGTRVIYLSPGAVPTPGGSAVILDVPGPGNNKVFGNCELSAEVQLCTFSGGTGQFTHFQATANVSYLGGVDYGWQGPYSFSPRD